MDEPSGGDDSDDSVTVEDLQYNVKKLEKLIKTETGKAFESYRAQQAEIQILGNDVAVTGTYT